MNDSYLRRLNVERPPTDIATTDIATIAATARRMDDLVAALAAECAKGEAGHGWVPCRVIRRLLGEVGA